MLASKRNNLKWGKDRQLGASNPNFSGGQYVDDKGYLRVLNPHHPYNNKGYVYMHRLVLEDLLGRYLEPWEVVHHINEIKLDNRVDNLYLCTGPEHTIIHRTGKEVSIERRNKLRNTLREKEKIKPRQRDHSGRFVRSDPT